MNKAGVVAIVCPNIDYTNFNQAYPLQRRINLAKVFARLKLITYFT